MHSPIVSSAAMRSAEQVAFDRGIPVESLMQKAGAGAARAILQFFPIPGACAIYAGKGHNGGDALVAGDYLQRRGWQIEVHLAFPESDCSELMRKNLDALKKDATSTLDGSKGRPLVIIDGLLGVGAKLPLRDPVLELVREINNRRKQDHAVVFALDIPTGLDSDSGEVDPHQCVIADCTVAIGFAKQGLVVDSAIDVVGRLEVVPLSELTAPETKRVEVVSTPHSLGGLLPRRQFSAYKNLFGRVGVVAGSEGFLGAAILSTRGALRAGAGLVNMFVPRELYSTVAALAPDEAMVKPVQSYTDLLQEKNVDVWAVGPGLGTARSDELLQVIEQSDKPMVVDADGLNMVAKNPELLTRCRGPRLLTPHPGEMKRLFDSGKMMRAETARRFCEQYPVSLLFKGSRTITCEHDRPLCYNTTGNPGMASGGMGDVLTGVCAGLLAQKLAPYDAARLGAWLCGRAAEIAVFQSGQSEESLLPRDVIEHLGVAFNDLRNPQV
ncbi:MAG: NAD(P)H-hydrate dehydratase [Chthoniobacterales bacterium]